MPSTELNRLLSTERLTPLMPMIYVAWADGVLTQQEQELITNAASNWLDDDSKDALSAWLNPTEPPSSRDLLHLLTELRSRCEELEDKDRLSLAEMGFQIAELESDEDAWFSSGLLGALGEMEEALGFVGGDATRDLIERQWTYEHHKDEAQPRFNVGAMNKLIDGRFAAQKQAVREFLTANDAFVHTYDITKAEQRAQTLVWLKLLADEGYGKVAYPETTGGDMGNFVATFEALASFDLSLVIKYGVQFGLFGGSIYFLGSDEQREKYLHDVADMRLPGCFAMSELGHGSNVRDLGTYARFDTETDEFVVHTPSEAARKEWIGNAALDGHMATVFAQLEVGDNGYGVHAFLVPIRAADGTTMPGVSIEDCGDKMGLNGVDNGRIWFDNVRIPRENLLSRYATVQPDGKYESPIASPSRRFFTMLGTLVGGRVAVASAANTVAKSALTIAVRYGAQRRQFGPEQGAETRILDYRSHKLRLFPRLAKTYAIQFALHNLVERYLGKSEEDSREVEALAAGIKAYATWHATDTVQECREACGGQGYLRVNRFASLKEDSDIFTTFEGDNTVLLLLAAKAKLTEFREQFSDTKLFGVVRYAANLAATAVTELNPVVIRQTDSQHLRSAEFLLGAVRYREADLVASVATRLKSRLDHGLEPFVAFNEVQDHLLSVAEAFVERIVAENFYEAIEKCEDFEIRQQLEQLFALHVLSAIHDDSGWFQEQGYIAGVKARAIRAEINILVDEIREQSVHLVDAFGIPDKVLDAPIGLGAMGG